MLLECYFESLLNGNYLPSFFSVFRSWAPQFCSVLFCSMFLFLILLPFGGHYRTLFAVQFRILLLIRLNCIHFPFTAAAAVVVATQLPTYIPFLFLLPLNTKGKRRKRRLTTLPHISYLSPNSVFNVCCCFFLLSPVIVGQARLASFFS